MNDKKICGRLVVVVILFLLGVLPAHAADTHRLLTLHVASTHFGVDGYNEKNHGLGLRLGAGYWYGMAGGYKNSDGFDSTYIGGGKTIARFSVASINLNGGLVTGYNNATVAPFLIPEFSFDLRAVQVMFSYLPAIKINGIKTDDALALSIGVNF